MTNYNPANNEFDYIIAGAGCAGLSLLVRLLQHPETSSKKILLADRAMNAVVNKTWCFWETGKGVFENIVYQRYERIWYHGDEYSKLSHIHPYSYKMIRGEDFHHYCMSVISSYPNVQIVTGSVEGMGNEEAGAFIIIAGKKFHARYIFNSILLKEPLLKPGDHYLLQHFKGWFIETARPVFDPAAATLMDFRVSQEQGTTFVYVMPFTDSTALVEYTVFSENRLEEEAYREGLHQYIHEQLDTGYTITGEEEGVIPMTSYRYPVADGNIINIGTAGGQTKPSTGYTFQFIQQQADELMFQLIAGQRPVPTGFQHTRFHFYDRVLLEVLARGEIAGDKIFASLFRHNELPQVLKFLSNQTSLFGELRIISVLPKIPFMKAALHQLFR